MTKDIKIKEVNKAIQSLLKKNSLVMDYNIDFPVYKQMPEEVQLALLVLTNHKMKIQFILREIKQ